MFWVPDKPKYPVPTLQQKITLWERNGITIITWIKLINESKNWDVIVKKTAYTRSNRDDDS